MKKPKVSALPSTNTNSSSWRAESNAQKSWRRIGQFGEFVQDMWPALQNLKVNDYDPIAGVFDAVMGNDFHAVTHDIRRKAALALNRSGPIHCLDLCCGTGIYFELLGADLPIVGYGLDRSSREIAIANKRTIAADGRIKFRIGDVISAEYPGGMDFVTINFDALNHLKGSRLWQRVFQKVLRSLTASGVLLFDVNLPIRLAHDWNSPEVIIKEDLLYVHVGFPPKYSANTIVRRTPMIIFSKRAGNLFTRGTALIEQFAMPVRDILQMLRGVGFKSAEVIAAPAANAVGHVFNKNRAFILARK